MHSNSSLRAVWLSGLAALVLLVGLGAYLSPLRPGVLALQLTFTPAAFGTIIHHWSSADLARYRWHLPVDGFLLAAYGAFGWLLTTRTKAFAAYAPSRQRLCALLLPLAACFDAAENVLHAWLTEVPRFGMPVVYAAAGSVALAKWLLLMLFAAVLAHALWRRERC